MFVETSNVKFHFLEDDLNQENNDQPKILSGTFDYGTVGQGKWTATWSLVESETQIPHNFRINET